MLRGHLFASLIISMSFKLNLFRTDGLVNTENMTASDVIWAH